MTKRFELDMFGLPVIMRHDYDDKDVLSDIRTYTDASVKATLDFLTNVPGGMEFETFCDVGCGDEYVPMKVKDRFKTVTGVDLFIDKSFAPAGNVSIIKGDWDNLRDFVGYQDVMFINHSLEHSANVFKTMEQVSSCQARGSVLFVAVPDADYEWAYSMTSSTTHFSIFNEGFLREVLQRFGYRVCVEKRCFRADSGELWAFAVKQ